MAMTSGGDDGGAIGDINVTPLVDVMLVLLIITMVTAPLLAQGVEIDLPKEDAEPLQIEDDDQLVVRIGKDLEVELGEGNAFAIGELGPVLEAVAEANPGKPLFLEADGNVPYKYVARVLALAKRSGIPRVGMVFDPAGDQPEDETPNP